MSNFDRPTVNEQMLFLSFIASQTTIETLSNPEDGKNVFYIIPHPCLPPGWSLAIECYNTDHQRGFMYSWMPVEDDVVGQFKRIHSNFEEQIATELPDWKTPAHVLKNNPKLDLTSWRIDWDERDGPLLGDWPTELEQIQWLRLCGMAISSVITAKIVSNFSEFDYTKDWLVVQLGNRFMPVRRSLTKDPRFKRVFTYCEIIENDNTMPGWAKWRQSQLG